MLPLIRGAAQDEGIFDPDATPRKIESGLCEGATEVQAFSVGMEDIGGRAFLTHAYHVGERCEEEVVELLAIHFVVLDGQAVGGFEGDVIWRIGQHKIRALPIHQCGDVVGAGGVAAHEAVAADRPHIPTLHESSSF
ncbi:Uncharacterised protein [Chlamydia trachomatis]|nr:Uncharacterised protein [Chlamydia trachomatis]